MSNIVPLSRFPEAELLAWLEARRWWEAGNGLVREDDSDVAAPTGAAPPPMVIPASAVIAKQRQAAPRHPDRYPTTVESTAVSPPIRRGAGRIILGAVLGTAAFGLAAVGLTVNTRFAASFGQTAEAAVLLAAIGLVIDLLAVVLPSAAAQLWRDRHRTAGLSAWGIWLITLAMTLLAAMGFAATNIGDGVAGRTKVATEATGLAADAARLRAERADIAESRSVTTIEADIQRAQPMAAAVWRQTAGCSDVTLAVSAAACADVLKLRRALGSAQRRDALDTELRAVETRLAALPAITTGDPQATMAADILAWASVGHVSLTPHDIHRLRITGLTIVPALAGIIFMFATMILQTGKVRGRPSMRSASLTPA